MGWHINWNNDHNNGYICPWMNEMIISYCFHLGMCGHLVHGVICQNIVNNCLAIISSLYRQNCLAKYHICNRNVFHVSLVNATICTFIYTPRRQYCQWSASCCLSAQVHNKIGVSKSTYESDYWCTTLIGGLINTNCSWLIGREAILTNEGEFMQWKWASRHVHVALGQDALYCFWFLEVIWILQC